MIPPSFVNSKVIDENGFFTPEWQQVMSQLLDYTTTNVSPEGTKVPSLTSVEIAQLGAPSTYNVNSFAVDSDTEELKFNLNGVYKTVTLT